MLQRLKAGLGRWLRDEAGNATVDWVVLIAGAMAFSLVVLASISGGVTIFSERAGDELAAFQPGTLY